MTDRLSAALFTIDDILAVTKGALVGGPSPSPGEPANRTVSSVCIDSREAAGGSLFVALRGERTDGHLFVEDALQHGSALSLVNRSFAEEHKEIFSRLTSLFPGRLILVTDTLNALQRLAAHHLRRIQGVVRIGVTGSTGKTTTKEMIGSVLLRHESGFMSPGNLNSEIGLPLSTFQVRRGHRYAIFEMGISHPGEMDDLAGIVRPDIAVVTNIGQAHVEFLGSQDGVAAEKKKIFSTFNGRQIGFVYEDEPYLAFLSAGVSGRIVPYGPRSTTGYRRATSMGLDGWDLDFDWGSVRLPFVGYHNLTNALCAVSIAGHLGVPHEAIRDGLEAARPVGGRGRVIRGPVTIIEDSYNANPESFATAIDFFKSLPWEGRKAIVAGSMKELGSNSELFHTSLGELAASSGADALFFFGKEMEAAYRRISSSAPMPVMWTTDFDELKRGVKRYLREGDLLLVKGSRGVELERLLPVLIPVTTGYGSCRGQDTDGGDRC